MPNVPTLSLVTAPQPILSVVKANSHFVTNTGDGGTWESAIQNWEGSWLWGGGETVTNNDTPSISLK